MKCFNHHDRDAFAVCTTCGKGLCLECMKEENGKIVCKNNKKCAGVAHKFNIVNILGLLILIVIVVLMIVD